MKKIKIYFILSLLLTLTMFWVNKYLKILHWPLQHETNILKKIFLVITIIVVFISKKFTEKRKN